jgi:hypothetical protein
MPPVLPLGGRTVVFAVSVGPMKLGRAESLVNNCIVRKPTKPALVACQEAGAPSHLGQHRHGSEGLNEGRAPYRGVANDGAEQIRETILVPEVSEHVQNAGYLRAAVWQAPYDGVVSRSVWRSC